MTDFTPRPLPWLLRAAILCLIALTAACGANRSAMPANTSNPDRFLFDRGTEALTERKWLNAREYFRQVVDNYPQSPLRPDAKLGIGDAYLGEKGAESLVLAANEYREFLTFYPLNPRADYAQYKLAMSHVLQMRAPDRDQTETRSAITEFRVFFDRYQNSPLLPEVQKASREARDRLSESSYRVGYHYYRMRWYPGAIDRFREVLKEDPEFSLRDKVYFYLADSLARNGSPAEAIPYFDRLLTEFTASEHIEEARLRLDALKTPPTPAGKPLN
jgi:outer membrane protein assembly factor BamD